MSWSTPTSFFAGLVLRASKLNIMQDDLAYLKGQAGPIDLLSEWTISGASNGPKIYHNGCYRKMWYASGIAGSAVTIIADGAGDVTTFLTVTGTLYDESGAVWVGTTNTIIRFTTASSQTFYTDGGANVVQVTLNANGSVTINRTAGTKTYAAFLTVQWK